MRIVVVGAQWGDEGKGKMVDYLAEGAGIVVRFSGGANAGHTIRIEDKVFDFHLVPSGILYPDKIVVLGNGMVIDPEGLFAELEKVGLSGIQWQGRVLISDRAHIIFPSYKKEDMDMDSKRIRAIGTTGRGIGVAYSRKANRDGVRVADLWDPGVWENLSEADRQWVAPYKERLEGMKVNLAQFMYEHQTENILLEGAQGALLDLDHGTYPYVSSGMSVSAGAAYGASIGPRCIDTYLGVFKAYQTRVGNGPFPTEMRDGADVELGNFIRERGHEYGVTTNRPRRIGHLDLVALRYSGWVNGLDGLILSHLNIFDGCEQVKVCVGYTIDGKVIDYFPASVDELERARPVLKEFPGWEAAISSVRRREDLPANARRVVEFIEEYVRVPVVGFSLSAERKDTFFSEKIW